jgi:hypothetical protein
MTAILPSHVWVMLPILDGLAYRTTDLVPLTRTVRSNDGSHTITDEVLCWVVGNELLVHPQRWPEFVKALGMTP